MCQPIKRQFWVNKFSQQFRFDIYQRLNHETLFIGHKLNLASMTHSSLAGEVDATITDNYWTESSLTAKSATCMKFH